MATSALAIKYRPQRFEEVVEQSVPTQLLQSLCKSKDLTTRNFLLIGSAGCGKTTLAKIMANLLNDGKGSPIELDAASNNGVENMREIVQQARMFPVGCKYKVYIIDECHALSSAAWQVLLRPIEEGVGNTIWIFCTTNPEKIPATIISRVQTFKLSKISTEGITNRLKYILDSEIAEGRQITYTQDAIQFVAKLANGGMRDAITMLDQALSYNLNITSESVAESLNLPNYDDYFELLSNYAKRDNKAIIESVNRVYNSGVNFNKWFEGFHAFVMNIVKFIFTRDINYTVIPSHYEEKISKYSTQHATICLTLADTLLKIIRDIKSSQYMQEIALSYLCFIPRKEVK